MQTQQNVPLSSFSTMRLGGTAAHFTEVHSRQEITDAVAWASAQNLPIIVVGGGSNIVWRDEGFAGLLIANRVPGFEVFEEDETNTYITVGAGENWDEVVAKTTAMGLSGIEALSLIPGLSGATPVQNVGAYGQEIANTLTTIQAFDMHANDFVTIPAADCEFGYRTSRFKVSDYGRFIIVSITLHLTKSNPLPPFYPVLAQYLEEHDIVDPTPQTIRDAVIAIRSAKLPDPANVPNNGSFFANPIISQGQLTQLQALSDGHVPHWPTQEGLVKVSAAWLLDFVGFKNHSDNETGMGTWPTQPLVLVNKGAQTTAQLLAYKQKIVDTVQTKCGVTLQQEPELLPRD